MHHHQEHAPGLEAQPVGHRTRRARGLGRDVRDVGPAARAFHFVPVVLDGHCPRLGQVSDLMRVLHPQVARAGQVSAPHGQMPSANTSSVLSGCSFQARNAPGAPGCLPGFRFHPALAGPALWRHTFPADHQCSAGILEEFPLLRKISRSSRAIFSACSAICALSSAFSARSRAFTSCSAATTPGASAISGTPSLHHSSSTTHHSVIKSTPSARSAPPSIRARQ